MPCTGRCILRGWSGDSGPGVHGEGGAPVAFGGVGGFGGAASAGGVGRAGVGVPLPVVWVVPCGASAEEAAVKGLVRLRCGWWWMVGARPQGDVTVVLQFDPTDELPAAGMLSLRLTVREAEEFGSELLRACQGSRE